MKRSPGFGFTPHHLLNHFLLPVFLFMATSALKSADPISYSVPYQEFGSIERYDPMADKLLPPEAHMEKLAQGFSWIEGPVWIPDQKILLFSDMIHNLIYRWKDGEGISVFLYPSGYTGKNPDGTHYGSNGLLLDHKEKLLICQHGDRRIARLNPDGTSFTTVVDRFEGHRFNSPNDLVLDSSGNLYFTDPPYGFGPNTIAELDFSGIYRVSPSGTVMLLNRDYARPNGIGLSPDEKTLYVSSSEEGRFLILAFPILIDGTLGSSRILFDATPFSSQERQGSTDGMTIDASGNIWTTAPGGVFIITPAGKHIATLNTGQPNGNCAFGGEDGSTLFIMANYYLVRIQTGIKGLGK